MDERRDLSTVEREQYSSETIRVLDRDPILEVPCEERKGIITRKVYKCHLTVDKLGFLWEKLKDFKTLFNDQVKGDFGIFVDHFVKQIDGTFVPAGLIWEVDDVGIFILNEILVGRSGKAHFVFWDSRFAGREELCRQMIRYIFQEYGLVKVTVEVPLYAPNTINAVERIGLIREGRLRKEIPYEGELFDVNVYSILDGEDFQTNSRKDLKQICFECGEVFSGEI